MKNCTILHGKISSLNWYSEAGVDNARTAYLTAVIEDLEARFSGLTESTDAFTVIADKFIVAGDYDEVETNLRLLADRYELDQAKVVLEWGCFEDVILTEGFDNVNDMSSYLSKHSRDYPTLNFLFQIYIVLPTSTSDVERGFSRMNLIKTKLRNRLGKILIHLLWISMYGPSFTFDWASLGRYVAEKVWGYKKA